MSIHREQPWDWDCPPTKNRRGYILPEKQNMEALVYGSVITGNRDFDLAGDYCVDRLCQLEDFEFDLLTASPIRTLIDRIRDYEGEPLVLEAEAPFSVLSALMNPVDLYLCFTEEPEMLAGILERIADASAAYLRACIHAGCRLISLADPTGSLNMVGEAFYKNFCGESALRLMRQCQPHLNRALIHLCPKMARSMILTGLAEEKPWTGDGGRGDYLELLQVMAGDPDVHFVGMQCLWAAGQSERVPGTLSI